MTQDLPDEVFRWIVEAMPEAVVYSDREGIIRLWNRGAETIFGYRREDALGHTLDLIIPERWRARHYDLVGHVAPERATDNEPDGPEGQSVGGFLLRLPIGIDEIGHRPQSLHHRHRSEEQEGIAAKQPGVGLAHDHEEALPERHRLAGYPRLWQAIDVGERG
jgi:PAS domain-containing protein